jgi:hypothetical protein
MKQSALNEAMSVPLRNLARDPQLQEAIRHSPDLQEMFDLTCRQASIIASGRTDPTVGEKMANQLLETANMIPGLYDPIISVIEDMYKTHGLDAARALVIERAMKITGECYALVFDRIVLSTVGKGPMDNG